MPLRVPLSWTSLLLVVWMIITGFLVASVSAGAALPPQHSLPFSAMPGQAMLQVGTTPTVRYVAETNTVYLGEMNADSAANTTLSLPELATTLSAMNLDSLLIHEAHSVDGHIWTLRANLTVERSVQLAVTGATVNWLRLAGPPAKPIVVTARQGGHLLLEGVRVTSWDEQIAAVDTTIADGRSYLLALEGGRMDVLRSEVAYLGAASGEPSGLAWRKRLRENEPATGATGRVEDSEIHHNYFGLYTYEAHGLAILRNRIHSNHHYGIDPHDGSQNFEVAHNRVYGNGSHGIIFSRFCVNNLIHHNEVYDNALHGIMLDRGTDGNRVYENVVYGNQDGIVVYQSMDNLITNNIIRNNQRGIRINATYDEEDSHDAVATNNQVVENEILDNKEHGVYLYARADRNLIRGNQILRSGRNGIYIKSGGNRIEENTIAGGTVGIAIVGGEYTDDSPAAEPALDPPGTKNVIVGTTVVEQRSVGIRLLGASHTQIGPLQPGERANEIANNGKDGVAIGDATNGAAATDNQLIENRIHANTRHGILVTDATSVRNRMSRNSITGNGQLGIKVESAAQQGIAPPLIITTAQAYIRGSSTPTARIEVYSDPGDAGQRLLTTVPATLHAQTVVAAGDPAETPRAFFAAYSLTDYEGQRYLGETTADESGAWSFALPADQNPDAISVLAIDGAGNTSAFSGSRQATPVATYDVKPDEHGNTTIYVKGIGSTVTLPEIADSLGATDANLLIAEADGIWRLNANLFLEIGVTLDLSATSGVTELRLRSEASSGQARYRPLVDGVAAAGGAVDDASFVYIRAYNSTINIDGIKITSWDQAAQDVDHDYSNGRAYLLAKYDAELTIDNADIGYLGSADGESYGLVWRDVNDSSEPDLLRTRVTGHVVDSQIHHNYYGIYTFQASDMLFRGNHFYANVRYGFDPHDFSHDFLVEGNHAYDNGAHGFILSRGCNNFILRNNESYRNYDPSDRSLAHGFMLDPGSPNSKDPQAPSQENVLENNKAYDNEGYGLRVLGSHRNVIRANEFVRNEIGVSIEDESTENLLLRNRFSNNLRYGIFLQESANGNEARDNEVWNNGDNGIYIRSHANQVQANDVLTNGKAGIAILIKAGFDAPRDNKIISNTVTGNLNNGIDLRNALQTRVEQNEVSENMGDGLYLKEGTTASDIVGNCFCRNSGYGIEINGETTTSNSLLQNSIYANERGAIGAGGGAVLLPAPVLQSQLGNTLTGTSSVAGTVELFADQGAQAQFHLGSVRVAAGGTFRYTHGAAWPAANLTAILLGDGGNVSDVSVPLVVGQSGTATPTPTPITGTPDPETPTATPTPTMQPTRSIFLPHIQSSQ